MSNPVIEVVLFDLGGVLVDFGGVGLLRGLSKVDDETELWRRWLASPWVRSFESGQCSAEDFANGVVEEWGLALSPDSFLEAFSGSPAGLLSGAVDLVTAVKETVVVGCLSNTNALHWEGHAARWPLLETFDFRFLSFELGLVKPRRGAVRTSQSTPADPERPGVVPRRQRTQRGGGGGRRLRRGADPRCDRGPTRIDRVRSPEQLRAIPRRVDSVPLRFTRSTRGWRRGRPQSCTARVSAHQIRRTTILVAARR